MRGCTSPLSPSARRRNSWVSSPLPPFRVLSATHPPPGWKKQVLFFFLLFILKLGRLLFLHPCIAATPERGHFSSKTSASFLYRRVNRFPIGHAAFLFLRETRTCVRSTFPFFIPSIPHDVFLWRAAAHRHDPPSDETGTVSSRWFSLSSFFSLRRRAEPRPKITHSSFPFPFRLTAGEKCPSALLGPLFAPDRPPFPNFKGSPPPIGWAQASPGRLLLLHRGGRSLWEGDPSQHDGERRIAPSFFLFFSTTAAALWQTGPLPHK